MGGKGERLGFPVGELIGRRFSKVAEAASRPLKWGAGAASLSPAEELAAQSLVGGATAKAWVPGGTYLTDLGLDLTGDLRGEAEKRLGGAASESVAPRTARALGWEATPTPKERVVGRAQPGPKVSSPTLPAEFLGSELKFQHPDGFVRTFQGGLALSLNNLLAPAGNERVLLKLPDFDKPLPVTVNLRRDAQGKLLEAPVVFAIAGLHGEGESDAYDCFMTRELSRLGNHVVLVPNSFARNYVQAVPHMPPTSMIAEAKVAYDVIHAVRDGVLPKEFVSETRVLGHSYGAGVALILASESVKYDQQLGRSRTIDGDITAVSPPLHWRHAQHVLDETLRSRGKATAWDLAKLGVTGLGSVLGLTELSPEQAKVVMGLRFESALSQTLMTLKRTADRLRNPTIPNAEPGDLVEKFDRLPSDSSDPRYPEFIRTLGYEKGMNELTYSADFYDGSRTAYSHHWVRRSQKLGGPPIKWISAKDDPLGVKDASLYDAPDFPLSKAAGNLLVYERGGHNFLQDPSFVALMEAMYRVPQPPPQVEK